MSLGRGVGSLFELEGICFISASVGLVAFLSSPQLPCERAVICPFIHGSACSLIHSVNICQAHTSSGTSQNAVVETYICLNITFQFSETCHALESTASLSKDEQAQIHWEKTLFGISILPE